MYRVFTSLAFAVAVLCQASAGNADNVILTIDADKVLNRVDEKIYGHFLEHIYHSVNGGLWGELIWNRSFELGPSSRWAVDGDSLSQRSPETDVRLVFGQAAWRDYEFSLEAKKTGGHEGFLILFRVANDDDYYWCNLGGWQNKRHNIERGVGGQRQGAAKAIEGSIEQDKWYRIRVRCEGPRTQVWLDNKQLFDVTDQTHPHLTGRVGVGTWATQARFRNLRVTSLDNRVLYTGLPSLGPSVEVAKSWEHYGQGQFTLGSANPLNGEYSQTVAGAGGEVGVQQTPLCIRQGEAYRGSLWARGTAADGLVVRLRDGDKTLAEQQLPKPGEQWQELPFELKPQATAENATLQVGLRGAGKIWLDQVSLMSDAAQKTGGFRPDLLQAVAALKPPVIRWPGGCYASLYRWRDGIGPQHKRVKYPSVIWDDVDVNSYGTDEFIRMCRAVGSEPLIVINVGMHKPREQRDAYCQEACDWVEYCNGPATSRWGQVRAANGHPDPYRVKYWEIDNEIWQLKPDDYASVVKQFVPAMKKVDPSIITLACGSGQLGAHWADGDTAVISQCAELVDYLSVHHYEDAAKFASGPAAAEKFWRSLADKIAASKNPQLKLYVSEWNAQCTDWRTGLYAGGALNVFERCGASVGLAGPALFLRHVSAKAWDNAFINFDHRTWFPAPNYVVMKLWREHFAPTRVDLTGDCGALNAVATKSADGQKVYFKVVNPDAQPVPVELKLQPGFAVGAATLQVVTAESLDSRNSLEKPDAIRPLAGKVDVDGQTVRAVFPRWSAAVLTLQKR